MGQGNKLSARKVAQLASLKKIGYVGDGQGLWLKDGSSWVFRYMLNGKARRMGLGPIHTVSLQEARIRARQARQVLLEGKDPLTVKQDYLTATILDAAKTITFKQAALDFLATDRVEQFKSDVCCPECYEPKNKGRHTPDCRLAAILNAAGPAK